MRVSMIRYDRCHTFAKHVAELAAVAEDAGIDVVGEDVVDAVRDYGLTRADFELLNAHPDMFDDVGRADWHAALHRVHDDPRYDIFSVLAANEQKAG